MNRLLHVRDFKALPLGSKLLLICHERPDGDALGSLLGLGIWLANTGYEPTLLCPDTYPNNLHFLPQTERLMVFEQDEARWSKAILEADLVVVLDHSRKDRAGKAAESLHARKGPVWMIDHHPEPEGFDACLHQTDASSTCELVWLLLGEEALTLDCALALMCGLLTDTGGFRHAVRPETFAAASHLLKYGVDYRQLSTAIFETNSLRKLKLTGFALSEKLEQHPELPVAWMALNFEELGRYRVESGDTEGLVNYALSIQGNEMAVLFQEREKGITRISFRSKGDRAVHTLAEHFFSGGGHKNAAGGRYEGTAEEALAVFLKAITAYFG